MGYIVITVFCFIFIPIIVPSTLAYRKYTRLLNGDDDISISRRDLKDKKSISLILIIFAVATFFIWLFTTILLSINIVKAGEVRVVSSFGQPYKYITEGLSFTPPWAKVNTYVVRRVNATYVNEHSLSALTSDKVMLDISVSVPYRLNPQHLVPFHSRIGDTYHSSLIRPIVETSIRDATASMLWTDIGTTDSGRDEFSVRVHRLIVERMATDLADSGFTQAEAQSMFTIFPVQVRAISPPTRVLNSINERIAANEDLARQQILSLIAEQEAQRRANEGMGVAMLFDALPPGYTADQIALILNAISTKTRADAMARAVESGEVNTIHIYGDVAPAIGTR